MRTCPICLDDGDHDDRPWKALEPGCGHAFHAACLMGWFAEQTSCPLCRAPQVVDMMIHVEPAGSGEGLRRAVFFSFAPSSEARRRCACTACLLLAPFLFSAVGLALALLLTPSP